MLICVISQVQFKMCEYLQCNPLSREFLASVVLQYVQHSCCSVCVLQCTDCVQVAMPEVFSGVGCSRSCQIWRFA
jgi:hypothetical protein